MSLNIQKIRVPLLSSFFIFAALFLLPAAAQSWEGNGMLAPYGILPEYGLFVVNNSFPNETVVDIVNLDTNKTVRANTRYSPYTVSGLAFLSRETSDALGISSSNPAKLRISQSDSNGTASSAYERKDVDIPSVQSLPVQLLIKPDKAEISPSSSDPNYTSVRIPDEYIPQLGSVESKALSDTPQITETHPDPALSGNVLVSPPPKLSSADTGARPLAENTRLAMKATGEKLPPASGQVFVLPPERQISAPSVPPQAPKTATVPPVPPALPSASDALPKIKQLERGSYYVQLGSFTQKEDIDRTISHLNNNKLPLLIQSAGNGDALRLMIGPMNEGESAALFLRLKNDGYKNIFIRKN